MKKILRNMKRTVKNVRRIKRHHTIHAGTLIVSLGLFLGGILLLWVALIPLPDFASFEQRKIEESTKIYDRTGEVLLFDVHKDIKRKVVPFDEMSRHIKNATVAIEDSDFYEHYGVKPTAIIRAFFINLMNFEVVQGGSTITQQVVKNTLLTKDQKIIRKIKEAVLSLKLEQVMAKENILELYLNEAPYGGNLYGIEEASLAFFGKSAKDIELAEAAYLAAIPKAPTYYSPYGSNKEALDQRKDTVLFRMAELGYISEEEANEAMEQEVIFNPRKEQGIKAPHFVMYVREYLENRYGVDVVETQGLRVTTSLDWELQKKAQEIVTRYAEFNTENFNASNAALVAIDPNTGHILSMVGSKDYFNVEEDGNFNTALAKRQPGSAFKPFVYATAFKKGFTPETVVFDLETQFSALCDAEGEPLPGVDEDVCYTPQNYDNIFRGPVTLRNALAQSMNIPAVKTLYLAGLRDSLDTAKDLGITTVSDLDRVGLTLVLGGGEVSLLELTSAYSVFANEGSRNPHEKILKIEDKNGNILEEFSPSPRQVIDGNVAALVNDVLSDNDARAPAFGYTSPLNIPGYNVGAKTGTTNDYRDAWIVGYSPDIAVGTWAGNNDNSSMEKRVAGFIVAPMWNEFMKEALALYPPSQFARPQKEDDLSLKPSLRGEWRGGETYEIDTISGKRATEYTPLETKEIRSITNVHTILHWINKRNPRGPVPENPEDDSQYFLWETPVRKWVEQQGIVEEDESVIPTEFDDVHVPEHFPQITILSPTEGGIFNANDTIFTQISTQGTYPIEQVDFFFNEHFLGSQKQAPFAISITPSTISQNERENNTIVVRVYDSVRNQSEVEIPLRVTY